MRVLTLTVSLLTSSLHLIWAAEIISSTSLPFNIDSSTIEGDSSYIPPIFPILPFRKHPQNPILRPNPDNDWESAYVYNPTAIVLNQTVFLLYRAQNADRTSSVGLAWSTDGYNFTRLDRPILNATESWEAGGGTEDPRLVRVNGTFYLTYTGWDLSVPQLCIATSEDLLTWTKYPPAFPGSEDIASSGDGARASGARHTKSGAIITEPTADGLYHMYFGDSVFYHATSTDLLNWTARDEPFATPIHPWENGLIEPGPAPVKTRDGRWLLIYNGMTTGEGGYRSTQYSVGQMLLDPSSSSSSSHSESQESAYDTQNSSPWSSSWLAAASSSSSSSSPPPQESSHAQPHIHNHANPNHNAPNQYHQDAQTPISPSSKDHPHPPPAQARPIARLETPFLVPSTREEEKGQVDLVVFAEGLVQFRGQWFLYYGQADETLGVAVAEVQA